MGGDGCNGWEFVQVSGASDILCLLIIGIARAFWIGFGELCMVYCVRWSS